MRFMLAAGLLDTYPIDGLDVDSLSLANAYTVVPNDKIGAGRVSGQPTFQYQGRMPLIEMTHEPHKKPHSTRFEDARVVFMTRDPRDIMVSGWFHDTRQLDELHDRFHGGLSEFIRSPRGIGDFVAHLNSWAYKLDDSQVLTYEAMRQDPAAALQKTNELLDIGLSSQSISHAVEAGHIDRMRKIEVRDGIPGHDYDRSDPDALRVRRGVAGGFVDHISESDQAYIGSALTELNPRASGIVAMTGYFGPEALQQL